jgi:hypothetical protein
LKNFGRHPKKTFSTLSARSGRSGKVFFGPETDLSAVDPKCSATRPAPAKADRVGVKDQVSPPAKISFLMTA